MQKKKQCKNKIPTNVSHCKYEIQIKNCIYI